MAEYPLEVYAPRLAQEWLGDCPDLTHREVHGTLSFVDISGFTRLTERLTRLGVVGSEELSDILDLTFDALLTRAQREGADLVKWGGDAVLLLFRGHGHAARGVRATAEMRHALYSVGRTESSAGRVTLRMSAGVHSGTFDFFLVGDPEIHRELIISGPAASATADLEAAATAGQIAIGETTAAALPSSAVRMTDEGLRLLRRAPASTANWEDTWSERGPVAPLLPPPVRAHLLSAAGEAEHRTISVAFVQFSGTDAMRRDQGPAKLAHALDDVVRNVQNACATHGVTFLESDINRDGGKIMLACGAPNAEEDAEGRMLRATSLIVERAGTLPLRVGVNRGRIFAADFGPRFRRVYSIKGDAINVAARVMGKAVPGQVLATDEVVDRAGAGIAAEPVPPFLVKGKRLPIRASLVTSAPDDVPLSTDVVEGASAIGREPELARIAAVLDQSARLGRGQVIELVGDSGMGKSSLLHEVFARADGFRVVLSVSGRFGGATAHQAMRRLLREVLELSPVATPSEYESALETTIRERCPEQAPWIPLLAGLLGVVVPETPEVRDLDERFRPAKLTAALLAVLRATLTGPTLLVFTNADQMDESSAEIVRELADEARQRPWVVLVTRRPADGGLQFRPESDDAKADDTAVVRVTLRPLDIDDSIAILESLTADRPVSPHILRAIAETGGGNPLYLKALLDHALTTGRVTDLPDSVEAVISAEIDRLNPRARTVLRFAAVVGERFSLEELRQAVAHEGWVVNESELRALRGFVEREGPVAGWWRFTNALVREVAYTGLPYRLRRRMHLFVGDVLEQLGDAGAHAERLSTHFFEGGDHTRALTYSKLAGDRARQAYSYPQAMTLYERAVVSARNVHGTSHLEVARLLEAKGDVADLAGLPKEAVAAYRRAKTLVRDDPLVMGSIAVKETRLHQRFGAFASTLRITARARAALTGVTGPEADAVRSHLASRLAVVKHLQGRHLDALRWSAIAVDEAKASNDPAALAFAYNYREPILITAGRKPDEPYNELALASYVAAGNLLGQAHALHNLAVRSFADGDWASADERFADAAAVYQRVGDTANEANTLYNRADMLQRQGRCAAAEDLLLLARRGGVITDDPELVALVDRELGKVRVAQRRPADARRLLEAARDALAELDLKGEALEADEALARCLVAEGKVGRALEVARKVLAVATAGGLSDLLGHVQWTVGVTNLAAGHWAEAEQAFEAGRDATGAWDGGHMRALNLTGLAAVAAHTGRDRTNEHDEAQALLSKLGVVWLPAPFDDVLGGPLEGPLGGPLEGSPDVSGDRDSGDSTGDPGSAARDADVVGEVDRQE